MSHPRYTSDEIAQLGQALYDQQIRAKLDAGDKGKFLVLDIETSLYEIDANELTALKRAKEKNPNAAFYILRVGYTAAYQLGGPFLVARQ